MVVHSVKNRTGHLRPICVIAMVLAFNHFMGVLYGSGQVYRVATHFFIFPPQVFISVVVAQGYCMHP